jgi:hypothetical protein
MIRSDQVELRSELEHQDRDRDKIRQDQIASDSDKMIYMSWSQIRSDHNRSDLIT